MGQEFTRQDHIAARLKEISTWFPGLFMPGITTSADKQLLVSCEDLQQLIRIFSNRNAIDLL